MQKRAISLSVGNELLMWVRLAAQQDPTFILKCWFKVFPRIHKSFSMLVIQSPSLKGPLENRFFWVFLRRYTSVKKDHRATLK
jgi:hypothetical protein